MVQQWGTDAETSPVPPRSQYAGKADWAPVTPCWRQTRQVSLANLNFKGPCKGLPGSKVILKGTGCALSNKSKPPPSLGRGGIGEACCQGFRLPNNSADQTVESGHQKSSRLALRGVACERKCRVAKICSLHRTLALALHNSSQMFCRAASSSNCPCSRTPLTGLTHELPL
jgi:hypothetical protein